MSVPVVTPDPVICIPTVSVVDAPALFVSVGAPVIVVDVIVFAWLIVKVVPVAPVTIYVPAATPAPEMAWPVTNVMDAVIVSVVLSPDVDPVPVTVALIEPVNDVAADNTDVPIAILKLPVS
jgi:hypothetical protein